MRIVGLETSKIIKSVCSPAFYVTPPILHQRRLVPQSVLSGADQFWDMVRFPERSINFYRTCDVIVAGDGLVFNSQRDLLLPTKRNLSSEQIERVYQTLAFNNTYQSLDRFAFGILCKQPGGQNYGHWLIEMLPKAFFAVKELGLSELRFLVPKCTGHMKSIIFESMEMIGVSRAQIVEIGPDPVYVDELILIEGLTHHGLYMSPLVFECLEQLGSQVSGTRYDRVYVTRQPSTSRDFEDAYIIEQILVGKGFIKVKTFGKTLREQIAAFKDARCVFGTMGAAMTNIAFCRPGTEVFLFAPASAEEFFFWFLAQHKKLRYNEVRCKEVGPQLGALPWDRKLYLSPAGLRVYQDAADRQFDSIALCDPDIARLAPPVLVTPERLVGRNWKFYHEGKPPSTEALRFLPDGKVGGYEHHNEARWDVEEGVLSFFDSAGWRSTKFEDVFVRDGKLLLRGKYRGNLDPRIVLCLEEA